PRGVLRPNPPRANLPPGKSLPPGASLPPRASLKSAPQPPPECTRRERRQSRAAVGVEDAAQVLRARRVRQHQRIKALQAQPAGERQHQGRELLAGVPPDDGGTQDPVRPARGEHLCKTIGGIVGPAAIELAELHTIAIEGAAG